MGSVDWRKPWRWTDLQAVQLWSFEEPTCLDNRGWCTLSTNNGSYDVTGAWWWFILPQWGMPHLEGIRFQEPGHEIDMRWGQKKFWSTSWLFRLVTLLSAAQTNGSSIIIFVSSKCLLSFSFLPIVGWYFFGFLCLKGWRWKGEGKKRRAQKHFWAVLVTSICVGQNLLDSSTLGHQNKRK